MESSNLLRCILLIQFVMHCGTHLAESLKTNGTVWQVECDAFWKLCYLQHHFDIRQTQPAGYWGWFPFCQQALALVALQPNVSRPVWSNH